MGTIQHGSDVGALLTGVGTIQPDVRAIRPNVGTIRPDVGLGNIRPDMGEEYDTRVLYPHVRA